MLVVVGGGGCERPPPFILFAITYKDVGTLQLRDSTLTLFFSTPYVLREPFNYVLYM